MRRFTKSPFVYHPRDGRGRVSMAGYCSIQLNGGESLASLNAIASAIGIPRSQLEVDQESVSQYHEDGVNLVLRYLTVNCKICVARQKSEQEAAERRAANRVAKKKAVA